MKALVIGFVGPKGCGKSTLCKAIQRIEAKATVCSFATPLRRMLFYGLGIPIEVMNDKALKEVELPAYGKSARQLMQTLGTEWGRNMVHPDVWVSAWLETVKDAERGGARVILVDDVRFENEVQAIKDVGGVIIRVVRNEMVYADGDNHASEAGIAKLNEDMHYLNEVPLSQFEFVESVEKLIGDARRIANGGTERRD